MSAPVHPVRSAPAAAPLFALEEVAFAYPGRAPCLEGVSLSIAPGERVAFVGANGAGKTTLLQILDGLFFPAGGRASYEGTALTEEVLETPPFGPRFRREVGLLFQSADAQLFCASVEEELAFGPLQLGLPRDGIAERTAQVLGLLGLGHLRGRAPQELSAGEKKRVALAALLTVGPRVLLLDEPTAGLDPRSQSMLVDLLGDLSSGGLTLVTATHDLVLLPHLADRIVVLGEDHRVAADGPADAILSDTALLERTNLIHAHRHRHGDLVHSHPHVHASGHAHRHVHRADEHARDDGPGEESDE